MDLLMKDAFFSKFHKHDISLAKDEWERKAIEVFNTRCEKYHTDIDGFVDSYEQWMEGHLRPINWRYISDSIVIRKRIDIENESQQRKREIREFIGKLLAEEIELVRFLKEWMTHRMKDIHSLLTSKAKTAEDKAAELDRQYFLYDSARTAAGGDRETFAELKELALNYVDRTGCKVDIEAEIYALDDLTLPDDYRACQMFLEMHRLGLDPSVDPDGLTKADWGAFYCYRYIQKIFFEVDFNHRGKESFPLIFLQQQKKPFLACVSIVQLALDRALQQLVECSRNIDHETYDKYRLTSHEIILAPIKKNISKAGISPAQTPEENIRNMVFALGHSVDTLDLFCDHLDYLLECGDAVVDSEKESLEKCFHEIQNLRGQIVYYTYSNTRGRQNYSEHGETNLRAIISGEELTAQSIERQLQLCDRFMRISRLIHVDDLRLLMEEKRTLSEEFMQYEESSSVSTYIHEKLIEILEEVTNQLQRELTERGLIQDYSDRLRQVFTKQMNLGTIDLPDELIQLLSSAEYLYHQYLSGCDELKQMDYSFIAILYYKALENLIDSQFYRPYISPIKGKKIDAQQFGKYFNEDSSPYILTQYDKVKTHLELGAFSHLFTCNPYPKEMRNFLSRSFNDGAETRLRSLGFSLREAAARRNKAAHGTTIITYDDAVHARTDTFDADWEYEAISCRGLIVDFINLLRRDEQ